MTADSRPDPVDPRCAWPSEPTLLARDGSASLLSWELAATPWLDQPVIPDDPAYLAFRAAIRDAGGEDMFPHKSLYGIDRIERAIADGWELWAALHNHTVKEHRGRPRLGVPVPSTSDVDISRSVARDLGLRQVRVTNGFYTIEVDAAELGELQGRGKH